MKAYALLICLGLLAACSSTPSNQEKSIEGFGSVKLGQNLLDARAALDGDGIYHYFTGHAMTYETMANDQRWYVAAQLIKNRVSSIVVSARPVVLGAPSSVISTAECDQRYDKTLEALRKEYGTEASQSHAEGSDTDLTTWIREGRSIDFQRHKVEGGCDTLSVTYDDHGIADHF